MTQYLKALSSKRFAALLLKAMGQSEDAFVKFKSSFQKEMDETLITLSYVQGGAVVMGISKTGLTLVPVQ